MGFIAFPPLQHLVKMVRIFLLFLCLLGLTDAGQEAVKLINLYDPHSLLHHFPYHNSYFPVAISVTNEDLPALSSSISTAESWLKTHLLATKTTTIVVGKGILCNPKYLSKWSLVLSTARNMYLALRKLGLEKEFKVSAAFSSDCFLPNSSHGDYFILKSLLDFLQSSNSTYSINPPQHFSSSLEEIINLVEDHEANIKKLGLYNLMGLNVIISHLSEEPMESISSSRPSLYEATNVESFREKPLKRMLSSLSSSKLVEPYPARPTPLPSFLSSIGFPTPANVVKNPIPPSPQTVPPPAGFSFAPESPPVVIPSNPPDVSTLPPCSAAPAPEPETGEEKRALWCVAKPNVPSGTLQEAMDYACGEGGADCEDIMPHGSCYFPDTAVAHASYAFNSYWQKYKNSGGSCNFGGTAMIINSDPSFLQCKFILL